MKIKPAFVASVIISIALAIFLRFGITGYMLMLVFKFEQVEAAYIVGTGLFIITKSVQLAPLCYRLRLIRGIAYEWLVFGAVIITAIDIAVTLTAWGWVEDGSIKMLNVILSIGIIGWAGLVRLLVLQWLPDRPLVVPPFVPATQSHPTNLSSDGHSQNVAQTMDSPRKSDAVSQSRSVPSASVLDLITKTPVSTLLIAQPGTGKTMTASSMGRRWVDSGHHVYYIDSKMDEKEINLWDDACTDRYQFDGTLLENPDDECVRLTEAFETFEAFRLRHLGDGKQTICILDELPAVMSVFKTYKPNPNAALNFINRIVNRLPSRNCHILLIAQNPSCTDTLPTGTLGTLKKIILTKAGGEAELQEWKGLTVIKPIDLSGVSSAIRNSLVGRGCYYSVVQKWLPMENLYREGVDYCRDTLSGGVDLRWRVDAVENSKNEGDLGDMPQPNAPQHSQQNVHNSVAPTTAVAASPVDTLDDLILDYFAAAKLPQPKSLRDIKYSSRIRSTDSSDLAIQSALDRLVLTEALATQRGLWGFPEWFDNN